MVYRASSKIARATQGNPVLKNKPKTTRKSFLVQEHTLWRSEDNFGELVLSFYFYVDSRD